MTLPPPISKIPEGHELIPVGESVTANDLVWLRDRWEAMGEDAFRGIKYDPVVRPIDAKGGYLPYGFYCRPVK